jgi:hypothetical protein
MSDRPTPETDAAVWMTGEPWDEKDEVVCSDFARKLERQRDEAREKLQVAEKPATEDDSTPPAIRQMWANVDAKMIADGFQKGEYGLWHKKEGAQ